MNDDREVKKISEELATAMKTVSPIFESAEASAPQYADRLEQARKIFNDVYTNDFRQIEKLTLANFNYDAIRLSGEMAVEAAKLRAQVDTLSDEIVGAMRARAASAAIETDSTISFTLASVGAAVTVVMGIAFVLVRFGIARPIGGLAAALKVMAANFAVVLPGLGRKDEVGQIAEAVGMVKTMAVEKARLEAEEVSQRQRAEAEVQAKAARERAEAAEEQAQVVGRLGEAAESCGGQSYVSPK